VERSGGVVVAQVVEVRDHPNSDKLCVARIKHAGGETELVVGVRNMREGDLVPWAPRDRAFRRSRSRSP
jgi:phenylalanyl-tRNA synthetase beta chain